MMLNGQIILNGVVAAALGNLMALAIAPTYRLFRYFDLSLAGISLIAGYVTAYCVDSLGWPVTASAAAAIVFATIIHVGLKVCLFRRLLPKTNSSTLLLTSLGVYICLIGVVSLVFGTELVAPPSQQAGTIMQLPIGRITYTQGTSVVLAIALGIVLGAFMSRSRLGKAIRATGSNAKLAEVVGIRIGIIAVVASVLSALCAGLVGALLALDVGLRPTVGLQAILLGVVAVVVGIRWGIAGIGLVALAIAFIQNLVAANYGPHWQEAIAFLVLLAFLCVRSRRTFRSTAMKATV